MKYRIKSRGFSGSLLAAVVTALLVGVSIPGNAQSLTSLPTAGNATGALTTSFSDDQGEHFVYVDFSGHVRQSYLTPGGSWTDQDLTVASGSTILAVGVITNLTDINGRQIIYTGSDDNTYEISMPFWGTWSNRLIIGGGGTLLAAFSDQTGEHILYQLSDYHIHQLLRPWGGGSTLQDLTAMGNGIALAVTNNVAAFYDIVGEHVIYVGRDNHVHQLVFPTNYYWQDQDLTANAQGPAVSGSSVTAFADANGEQVYYVAAVNGAYHIDQLVVPWGGTRWSNRDLSSSTGANPTSNTPLISFADVEGQHLFYVGANAHIYQIYGGQNQDVTLAGRSTVIAYACGFALVNGLSDVLGDHVFYLGSDNIYHQLVWNARGWSDQSLPTRIQVCIA